MRFIFLLGGFVRHSYFSFATICRVCLAESGYIEFSQLSVIRILKCTRICAAGVVLLLLFYCDQHVPVSKGIRAVLLIVTPVHELLCDVVWFQEDDRCHNVRIILTSVFSATPSVYYLVHSNIR